jgi:hypothetical protein
VLTNFIQADPALSGSVDRSALPLQFAALGPNSFASSLQTAGAPAPATPRSELVAVAGREKPAEKKTAEDSKKTQPGQAMPAMEPAVNAAAKPLSLIAIKPETVLPVLQESTDLSGSVPIPGKSSQSDDAIGLAGAASPAGQETSVGPAIPAHEFQQGAASVLRGAAVDAKPSAGSDPPLSEDVAVASAEEVTPLAAGDARSQLTPLDETKAGTQMPPADKVAEASIANSEPSAILPSALAGLDTTPLSLAPSTAEFAANFGKGDPKPVIPPPSVSLNSPHPDSGAPNVAGVNLDASGATTQSGNGSTRGSPEALASSSVASEVASSMSFPPEISRPISAHAVTPMKSVTTTLAVDAHIKESSAVRVTTAPEHTTSKPADAFSNPSDTNALLPSPSAVPASPTGPPTSSEQPGITVPNVLLAQVSPATNQDPGSQGAPLPAAERQAPAENPPAPLPAASTVEVARLVAGVAQSEMHIGLRTQAFGSVEVHTVVRDSQVGLTVGSERGDLRGLLAPEVSGLQTSFRQQDLRFDNIHFLETSAGTTAGFSGGADSHSRSSSQQHASTGGLFTIQNTQEDPAELDVSAGSRVRLNVHA